MEKASFSNLSNQIANSKMTNQLIKRTILGLLLTLSPFSGMFAQSNWELGGRFGNDFSIDVTVPINAKPRLHGAAYFYNDFGVGAYFDWMFGFSTGPQGLKIYPGVGLELYFGNDLDIGIAGNFGIEYSFDFPLTIGLDWRPGFMLTEDFRGYDGNWGIMARYRFGEGTKLVAR